MWNETPEVKSKDNWLTEGRDCNPNPEQKVHLPIASELLQIKKKIKDISL